MGMRGPGARPVRKAEKQAKERPKRRRWQRKGLTRAGRVIAFIEGLKLTAGSHAGKPFKLRPWQRRIVEGIYATDSAGVRQVRQALATMPRKNGKTELAAGLALAHLAGPEAEPRGEVYSAASDRNQAGRIFRELEAFILADADLAGRCNIQRFAKRIEVLDGPGKGSVYEALSSDAKKAHGLSPSFVVCDELAQWLNRELYDNLVSGVGARDEPLTVVISTQSADPNHVMSEIVNYGRAVLDGTMEDPTFHATIYSAPEDADPWDEATWHACNPALGDFRSLQEMRDYAAKAKRIPAREASFRLLYLNQSISTEARFISAADWKACGAPVDRAALAGRPCWAGLDLSSTTDLTALVLLFPEDGFQVLPFFWLPAADIEQREQRDHVPYRVWREKELIEFTPGRAIDKRAVALRLAEISGEFDIRGVGFDRWRIKDLQKILDDEGIFVPLVEIGQGYQSMGPAVDQLETLVLDQQLRHGMNPVLTWNVASAIVTSDPAGNRKLDKARSIARIDGLVALAMAAGLHSKQPAPMTYNENSIMVIAV
jgi:phage terminase large subunit-like protein